MARMPAIVAIGSCALLRTSCDSSRLASAGAAGVHGRRRCRHGLALVVGADHRRSGCRQIAPVDDGIDRDADQQRCGRPRPSAPAASAAVSRAICCRRRRQRRRWRCRWRHDQRLRRSAGDDTVDLTLALVFRAGRVRSASPVRPSAEASTAGAPMAPQATARPGVAAPRR